MSQDGSDVREWSNDNYRHPRAGGTRRYLLSILLGIAFVYLIFFVSLPYFIFMPGTAEEIKPMVSVSQKVDEEKGALMLTTVRVSSTNILNYIIAAFHPYQEIQRKAVVLQGNSESEYSQQQEYVMLTSQSSALVAAYKKAAVPYQIRHEGVIVLKTSAGLPGEKVLKPGDTLIKAGDTPIQESKDLFSYMEGKKAGESVAITYRRDKAEMTETLTLATLPLGPGETTPRAGIGVTPADMQSVKANNEEQQVTIKAGEIGGPSAGLMFSLEIYNQLVPEDITKGYRIAGTGTIDNEGNVGEIGGIGFKVIAADKAGAEIFFAPKDSIVTNGNTSINNYSEAVARAKEIKTNMKVVEVETMEDALTYLASLPPKSS
jgi:PDZ domain-containing protein